MPERSDSLTQLEYLIRSASSLGGQREALAALDRSELRGRMTVAGAVAFGAVPVADLAGRMVFATVPGVNPDCERALAAAVGGPVTLVPFDEALVREAVSRHYLRDRGQGGGVDLPTFESADFLLDPVAARRLLSEKAGALPATEVEVPEGCIAFVDMRVHSIRRALDRPFPVEFAPTAAAMHFRLEGDGAVLFREKMPDPETRALVSTSVFYDGDEHVHAMTGCDLAALPFVLHPSELQLARIERRRAHFWVYDRIETVRAGPSVARAGGPAPKASWSCRYWFLHFGARTERELRLDVLAFDVIPRSKIRLAERSDVPTSGELARMFGLDFPKSG